MYFRAVAGLIAGLVGGVISGALFMLMTLPNLQGGSLPLLTVIAHAIGFNDPGTGWSFHLFVSAFVGAIFGVIAGKPSYPRGFVFVCGVFAGVCLWMVAALICLPMLLGFAPFATMSANALRPAFWMTLIGSLIYGVCLAVAYMLLYLPVYAADYEDEQRAKAERERAEQDMRKVQPRR
jgi:hypothetical protein